MNKICEPKHHSVFRNKNNMSKPDFRIRSSTMLSIVVTYLQLNFQLTVKIMLQANWEKKKNEAGTSLIRKINRPTILDLQN